MSQLDPRFDDVLEDLDGLEEHELRELIERAHQIELLTKHKGWGFLQDYLVALTTTHQRKILSGGCRNIEEYRVETGFVRGLQASLDAAEKLQSRIASMRQRYDDVV